MENVRGHLSLGGLQVIGELAEIGYDAEWRVISAASVGANHKRERIIIVAYPNYSELGDINKRRVNETSARKRRKVFVADSSGCSYSRAYEHWLLEPDVGRVAHGVSNRVDRLRGLGNAVVPQVAEIVGRLVMKAAEQ
jgi:DNA (cytosine-5)-methyltransferase 1